MLRRSASRRGFGAEKRVAERAAAFGAGNERDVGARLRGGQGDDRRRHVRARFGATVTLAFPLDGGRVEHDGKGDGCAVFVHAQKDLAFRIALAKDGARLGELCALRPNAARTDTLNCVEQLLHTRGGAYHLGNRARVPPRACAALYP